MKTDLSQENIVTYRCREMHLDIINVGHKLNLKFFSPHDINKCGGVLCKNI